MIRSKIIKDMFTEKDGVSFCPLRALLILGTIFYLGLEFHDAIMSATYSFGGHCRDFATGLANILGLGGGAVAGKSFSEDTDAPGGSGGGISPS